MIVAPLFSSVDVGLKMPNGMLARGKELLASTGTGYLGMLSNMLNVSQAIFNPDERASTSYEHLVVPKLEYEGIYPLQPGSRSPLSVQLLLKAAEPSVDSWATRIDKSLACLISEDPLEMYHGGSKSPGHPEWLSALSFTMFAALWKPYPSLCAKAVNSPHSLIKTCCVFRKKQVTWIGQCFTINHDRPDLAQYSSTSSLDSVQPHHL